MAYYVSSGQISSGIILDDRSMAVLSGGTAIDTQVTSSSDWPYHSMSIQSGGSANGTTVQTGGILSAGRSSVLTNTTIETGGMINGFVLESDLFMKSGVDLSRGIVDAPDDSYYSYAILFPGQAATDTRVLSGGHLWVENDVQLANTFVEVGGRINGFVFDTDRFFASGLHVSGGTISEDADLYRGQSAQDMTVAAGVNLDIHEGASVSNITVEANGTINGFLLSTDSDILVNTPLVFSNAIVEGELGYRDGWLYNDMTAYGTVVNSYGWMVIYGTAYDTTVNSEGTLRVVEGSVAVRVTVNNGGYVRIGDEDGSGSASYITVSSGGSMHVGDADYTEAMVGFASHTTVLAGGTMTMDRTGTHRGTLMIEDGAMVTVDTGSVIDFTVSEMSASDPARINNLSLIGGAPTYTITVSALQTAGSYTLAGGASGFTGTLSIGTAETGYGIVTVNGGVLRHGTRTYRVSTSDSSLILTVGVNAIGKFTANGSGEALTVDAAGNFKLTKFPDKQPETIGVLDTEKWALLDSFDFNGDGLLELAVEDKTTGNVFLADDLSGGISESKLLNGTCLGMLADGYSYYGAGSFDGKAGQNDILLKGPAFGDPSISLNYGLPVWSFDGGVKQYDGWLGALVNTWQPGKALDGDTSDPADINAKNYQYDIVGIGDFNGDGRSDVMLQNTMPDQVGGTAITGAGDIFTFLTGDETAVKTGAGPTVCYAGKVDAINLNGWGIAGTGDFNNDGIDDVLLQDQASGGIACWIMNHGQMQNSEWIGTKASGDEIAGIRDVNGDGTDDVVLSTDSGYEAWIIQNGQYSTKQLLA